VFVIGGGPSVAGADGCLPYPLRLRLFNSNVIGINNAGFLDPGVDILFFGDRKWYEWNKDRVNLHNALIVTSHGSFEHFKRIKYLRRKTGSGFNSRPPSLMWNRSSGGSGIALAVALGAKRVVLIGYDMKLYKTKNFHKEHREKNPMTNPFPRFIKPFYKMKEEADQLGIEIVNTTPNSAIVGFPFVPLTEAIEKWTSQI